MKRFYKIVSKVENPQGGYRVLLDDRPVKMPSGNVLGVPTSALADMIVQEWGAQDEAVVPDSMPITQILITVQDRIAQERAAMEQAVFKYLDTDLICYRTEQPEELARRQAGLWDPWIDWFEKRSGARLETTTGLAALSQEQKAHDFARHIIKKMDDYRFGICQLAVSLSGSLVLGLAFTEGALDKDLLLKTVRIEEDYKTALYNEDVHGLAPLEEKKREALIRDLDAAQRFLRAL